MPENRIRDLSHLSDDDEILVWRLSQAGKTQVQIAQVIGCNQSSVSRALQKLDDTRDLAKLRTHNAALLLAASAVDGAQRAARDGKPEAALELLDRLDVVARKQNDAGRAGMVQVIIGMPGSASGPAPSIDLSPVPRNELASANQG